MCCAVRASRVHVRSAVRFLLDRSPGLPGRGLKSGRIDGVVAAGFEARRDDGTGAVVSLLVKDMSRDDTERVGGAADALSCAVRGHGTDGRRLAGSSSARATRSAKQAAGGRGRPRHFSAGTYGAARRVRVAPSGYEPFVTSWLVTGSSGHLGEALVRVLRDRGDTVVGVDSKPSPWTDVVSSLTDRAAIVDAMVGVDHVLHTATLHKPHVGSHTRQQFVDTNISGTLAVLDAARTTGARSVVFTSSTSAFGRALTPGPGEPAAWITEDVPHRVRNIYGATKTAAEDLCELAAGDGLPVVVLRTSRFFPEADDRDEVRARFDDANLKAAEFLYRRVDIEDVVTAHLLAAQRAPSLGFARYIVSATTPFGPHDCARLAVDAREVAARIFPDILDRFAVRGWSIPETIDRVYVNARARRDLGWTPEWDFGAAAALALSDGDVRSPLARLVGMKGYHDRPTGVYTL